jgi:hypothetical protein
MVNKIGKIIIVFQLDHHMEGGWTPHPMWECPREQATWKKQILPM